MNKFFIVLSLLLICTPSIAQKCSLESLNELLIQHSQFDSKTNRDFKIYVQNYCKENKISLERFVDLAGTGLEVNVHFLKGLPNSALLSTGYSTIGWGSAEEYIDDHLNIHLLKIQKSKSTNRKLVFGYIIFQKDNLIYCLVQYAEI